MTARTLRLLLLFSACVGVTLSAAGGTGVRGRIVDASGLPLPGVTVQLTPRPAGAPIVGVTDGNGTYALEAPAGRYDLHVELSGFEPVTRPDLTVGSPPLVVDLTLPLATLKAQVTVVAQPHAMIGQAGVDQPEIITRKLFDSALLWNNEYSDALPLLPNVVRAPDGQISVAGARTEQGALQMNGFNESDPVTGEPAAMVPLDAVGSMQVYSGFYPADLGQAAGGVTTIDTRPGSDTFQLSTMGFMPRMRFGRGLFDGVDSWEPSVGVRGPIVKGRAWFAEALDYQYNHNQFETAAGTQQNLFTSLSSLSQVDVRLSANQHLGLAILADPQTTDAAGITEFTPAATAPALRQGGWSATGIDRLIFGAATTVESRFAVSRTDDSTMPNGSAPYVVGHDVTSGSYFDTQNESAYRVEAGSTISRVVSNRLGQQLLRAGATAGYVTAAGTDAGAPVTFLRSDGSISQTVNFPGTATLAASADETSAFLEDAWSPARSLTLNLGVRYDRSSAAAAGVLAPRVGWTIKLPDGRSTLSGGAGVFADKVVLQALTFGQLPPRVVQLFTAAGVPDGPARVFQNVFDGRLQMPRATGWSLQFDRTFSRGWITRVKYQDRRGTDEPVITPETLSATTGLLALSSTGQSHAWSVETTVGYRAARSGDEVYVSYVRSSSTGSLNDLNSIDGLFKTVLVQPDAIGPLAVDVPNRLLTWGVLQLPLQLSVAPFVEVRSGFPYTAIDDSWNVVGARNGMRYAPFASLNLAVYRIVHLSRRLPAARLGLQVFNILSANNARDIQTDVMSPAFGTTYNPAPREVDGYFELLWGTR
ncbi:MAG TPA: TonB-dependent receptor [Vicinamibacterales bacterium]|nr:TonB-dependent receptor [Vicinamibacterales bacterium]